MHLLPKGNQDSRRHAIAGCGSKPRPNPIWLTTEGTSPRIPSGARTANQRDSTGRVSRTSKGGFPNVTSRARGSVETRDRERRGPGDVGPNASVDAGCRLKTQAEWIADARQLCDVAGHGVQQLRTLSRARGLGVSICTLVDATLSTLPCTGPSGRLPVRNSVQTSCPERSLVNGRACAVRWLALPRCLISVQMARNSAIRPRCEKRLTSRRTPITPSRAADRAPAKPVDTPSVSRWWPSTQGRAARAIAGERDGARPSRVSSFLRTQGTWFLRVDSGSCQSIPIFGTRLAAGNRVIMDELHLFGPSRSPRGRSAGFAT